MRYVRKIDLSNNEIFALPVGGFRDVRVWLINLSSNKLSYIPANAFSQSPLETIVLSNNQIAGLHLSSFGTNYLKWIVLDNNKLECLSEVFADTGFRGQSIICLNNNQLTTILPSSHGYISLQSNPINCSAVCWVGLKASSLDYVDCVPGSTSWRHKKGLPHPDCPASDCIATPTGE